MLVRRKLITAKASALLEKWKVREIPIDVYELAHKEGVQVKEDDPGDDSLSGFLLVDRGIKLIGVNKNHSKTRRRFTVAHELGHLFLHPLGNGTPHIDNNSSVGVHFRDSTSSTGTKVEEIEANYFAGELLMPAEKLKLHLQKVSTNPSMSNEEVIEKLASDFGVSLQAMTVRLSSLGLLKI